MMLDVRKIGTTVTYKGEPYTKGETMSYEPIGDYCIVKWDIPPKTRGIGWHQTHMKAYHLIAISGEAMTPPSTSKE